MEGVSPSPIVLLSADRCFIYCRKLIQTDGEARAASDGSERGSRRGRKGAEKSPENQEKDGLANKLKQRAVSDELVKHFFYFLFSSASAFV